MLLLARNTSLVGRVRPVWQPGFAGTVEGFDGDPSITIGFVVDGIDGTHPDLAGRCAYWSDLSGEGEANPVDYFGHGSMTAGIAVGTGQADALDEPALHYTYVGDYPSPVHVVSPISFTSSTYVQVDSEATWIGGWSSDLIQIRWIRGGYFDDLDWIGEFVTGGSDLHVSNTYLASHKQVFAVMLAEHDDRDMDQVVITNSLSKYPTVGDGYPRFRGVAPACRWASARIDTTEGWGLGEGLGESLDDLVLHREANNIKVINISHGLVEDGLPCESQSLRDKVNSAVRNGVVVVSAAGNSAYAPDEALREMADPPRAALAITVGASDDENALTYYSSYGFTDPDHARGEDHKPDMIAPGGSIHQSGIMSVDTGCSDGYGAPDKQPNDYANEEGTSFASPFVAGCAALVIDAMQQQGAVWGFHSDEQPRFVKMVLCATASETNAKREEWQFNPSLERAAEGPEAFPAGKDCYEGYGVINADAAVEAVCLTYNPNSDPGGELGAGPTDRRVWARKANLVAGGGIDIELDNPGGGDFDLYLYSGVPSETGTPIILACSTHPGEGVDEALSYTPDSDTTALLVVKRVSGSGVFDIDATLAGPPIAKDLSVTARLGSDRTVRLQAQDDGSPNPPGVLTYTIVSLPVHGHLQHVMDGTAITAVPRRLDQGVDQVVYRPDPEYIGEDTFTFRADDGGASPSGGQSNVGTVTVTVRRAATETTTIELSVSRAEDDVSTWCGASWNTAFDDYLKVGMQRSGMRFQDVPIPPWSEIVDAHLEIYLTFSNIWEPVDGVIQAEDVGDAAGLMGADRHLCGLPLTEASTSWVWDTGHYRDWHTSPDMSEVIQEIVDGGDWSAGNAVVIVYWSKTAVGRDLKFCSYDNWASNPAYAPKLIVTYTH